MSMSVLNPAAKEFVPVRRSSSETAVVSPGKERGKMRRSAHSSRSTDEPGDPELPSKEDGVISVSPRAPSSLASTSSTETTLKGSTSCRSPFRSVQQLKVHAPGCECQRLRRSREELGEDSGYLVTSRDPRQPDVHFGADYGFCADDAPSDEARRDRESRLSEAIASSDVSAQRLSCAACLLDGHWRNGAVCLVGDREPLAALCARANRDRDHTRKYLVVDDCGALPPPEVVLNATNGCGLSVCTPDERSCVLERCVPLKIVDIRRAVAISDPGEAVVVLPFVDLDGCEHRRKVRVDIKHHVLEALEIVPLNDDDETVCLTYVDNRGVVSIDLPGGKRRLAETAWEAAARETADECCLHVRDIGDIFHGTRGRLAARLKGSSDDGEDQQASFDVEASVDGQSVRFFVLKAQQLRNLVEQDDQRDDQAPRAADDDDDNQCGPACSLDRDE